MEKKVEKVCGNCEFFRKADLTKEGSCFRYPPNPMALNGKNGYGQDVIEIRMIYPQVQVSSPACGELSVKPALGVIN